MLLVKLPVFGRVVTIELPVDSGAFLLRYLIAALGKDVRTGRDATVRERRAYANAIVTRRLADLRDHGSEAYESMAAQTRRWLEKAADFASPADPHPLTVAEHLLGGSAEPTVTATAWALVGHDADDAPGCEICEAAEDGRWSDVLALTETDSELLRELARAFSRCGTSFPWDEDAF